VLRDPPAGSGKWVETAASDLPGVDRPIAGDATGHANFLRAAFTALDTGGPLPISGAQARHNLAIIEAAREASASRRAVEVA
jgi:predicted dehydrogenase